MDISPKGRYPGEQTTLKDGSATYYNQNIMMASAKNFNLKLLHLGWFQVFLTS